MTVGQVYLLRTSFRRVEQQSDVAALVFYRRLFELDPHLRPLFKGNIEAQAGKLIQMLGLALSLSERPEYFKQELQELGARHAGYGVREEHYQTVGKAMLEMMAAVLGKAFTPDIEEAWSGFYRLMADTMKQGAAGAARRHQLRSQ